MNDFIEDAYAQARDYLPSKQMIIAGRSVCVTANGSTYYKKGSLGGYEPEQTQQVSCVTSELPEGAEDITGQRVTINGEPWRVAKVTTGASITHIDLVSVDED